jgi:hypothetical protein
MADTQLIDLADILDVSHENKWVAITPDYRRVVAASERLPDLMRQVAGKDVIFHRVLPHDVSFVPRHPEIDRAIAEGLGDIRAGRVTPAFASTGEYQAWRKTPEGKKFAQI